MHRLHWIIAAFLFLPGSVCAEPTASRPGAAKGSNEMEVRLVDGSRIHMVIVQENLEIVTKYGTLTVPTRDIRKIEFGTRPAEGVRKRITDDIGKLGRFLQGAGRCGCRPFGDRPASLSGARAREEEHG